MKMDLKTLLLRSISTGQVLRCQKRLHLGKKCFAIDYEVSGKFLSVKSVKQVHSKMTFLQRLRRRRSSAIGGNGKKLVLTSSQNLDKLSEMLDAETQTPRRILHSRATETPKRIYVGKPQQTLRVCYRRQAVQTEVQANSIGLQTDRRLISHSSQTDWCQASMATQTQIDVCNNQMQTELNVCMEGMQIEKEAVIFLLNEIGEMIINQNHLLNNNSTLLGQISEIMMLNRIATRQHNAARLYKKLDRKRKMRRHVRFCGNYPRVCLCRKPYRWRIFRNKATQIDIEIMHNNVGIQTKIRKRMSCFQYCYS